MPAPPRLLIVGHDASRTGAPRVLASFLGWLATGPAPPVEVVLRRGGPLLDEIAALAPTTALDRRPWGGARRVAEGAASVGAPGARHALAAVDRLAGGRRRADVVLVNALAALPLAAAAAMPTTRLVCWVHELDGVAERVLPAGRRGALVARVDHWVAAGAWVADMLVQRWDVAPDRVTTVPEPVDPPNPSPAAALAARAALDLPGAGPLLLGVGTAGPRKGTDLFVTTVAALATHPSRPVAAWLGGDPAGAAWAEAALGIAAAGLGDRVRLVPTLASPFGLMAAADLLLAVAREDPWPLGAAEAAALGTPVAAFATGGAATLVAAAGLADELVVDGIDVLGLAAKVATRLDRGDGPELGRRLQAHVVRTGLTSVVAPIVWDALVRGGGGR